MEDILHNGIQVVQRHAFVRDTAPDHHPILIELLHPVRCLTMHKRYVQLVGQPFPFWIASQKIRLFPVRSAMIFATSLRFR